MSYSKYKAILKIAKANGIKTMGEFVTLYKKMNLL